MCQWVMQPVGIFKTEAILCFLKKSLLTFERNFRKDVRFVDKMKGDETEEATVASAAACDEDCSTELGCQ